MTVIIMINPFLWW